MGSMGSKGSKGSINDIVVIPVETTISVEEVKLFLSEALNINIVDIELKQRGKSLNDETQHIKQSAKLLGFIHQNQQSRIAPIPGVPVIQTNTNVNVKSKGITCISCIGWKRKCTFNGNSHNDGYCSLCFKHKSASLVSRTSLVSHASRTSHIRKTKNSLAPPPKGAILQSKFNRCWLCNKNIGLLGFKCKCKYTFCGKHRHPQQHGMELRHRGDQPQRCKNRQYRAWG